MPVWVRAVLCASTLLALNGHAAAAEGGRRIALVVGNAAYGAAPLPTTFNDAALVAQSLAQAGYAVTAAGNADAATLRTVFADFVAKARAAGADATVVVYLAGYGLQYDGDNFFVPVDARIARDEEVPAQAARLSDLAQPIEALPARARAFIFDLARPTPFAGAGLPLATGLAIPALPEGTLAAFNAAPGTVAAMDGVVYGVFARALAEAMQVPGLPLDVLLRRVRLRVAQRSNGSAVPFDTGSADVVFHPAPAAATPPKAPPGTASAADDAFAASLGRDTLSSYGDFLRAYPNERAAGCVRALLATRREALLWSEALAADTARAYWTYMRRYPRGPHFGDVRRRLAALHVALEPPPRFDLYDFAAAPPPPADEAAMFNNREATAAKVCWSVMPPLPATPPPPQRDAFVDMPPPPIMPIGVLPIPAPVAVPAEVKDAQRPGEVVQPYVAGSEPVVTSVRDVATVTTSGGRLLCRLDQVLDRGRATLIETNGSGAVVSRTVTTRDDGAVAIVQTGPKADPLLRITTRIDADGGRVTVLGNSRGQPIATVRSDREGAIVSLVRDARAEQFFVLEPGRTPDGGPIVITSAEARAIKLAVPRLPPLVSRQAPPVPAPAVSGPNAGAEVPVPPTATLPSIKVESGAAPVGVSHALVPAAPATDPVSEVPRAASQSPRVPDAAPPAAVSPPPAAPLPRGDASTAPGKGESQATAPAPSRDGGGPSGAAAPGAVAPPSQAPAPPLPVPDVPAARPGAAGSTPAQGEAPQR